MRAHQFVPAYPEPETDAGLAVWSIEREARSLRHYSVADLAAELAALEEAQDFIACAIARAQNYVERRGTGRLPFERMH